MRPTDPLGAAVARARAAADAVTPDRPPVRRTRLGPVHARTWGEYGGVLTMDLRLWYASCIWQKCDEMGLDPATAMCVCLPGERDPGCPLHELEWAMGGNIRGVAEGLFASLTRRMGAAVRTDGPGTR